MRSCATLSVALGVILSACAASAPRPVPPGPAAIAVVAPPSETDPLGILVDGVVQRGSWYCSAAPAPQTYEIMFFDGTARAVHAVGFVPANVGPDGIGPVRVRVQTGHGVMAEGETFRGIPHGASDGQQVVVLPHAVTGDHVVVTFERRSRHATALCLGEITAWGEDYPREGATITSGEPYVPSADAGSSAPETDAGSSAPP